MQKNIIPQSQLPPIPASIPSPKPARRQQDLNNQEAFMGHITSRQWSFARMSAIRLFAVIVLLSVAVGSLVAHPTEDDSVPLIYVPGVSGGITEINSTNNSVFGTAPWAHGSNGGIVFTPDGTRMYVSNHETSSVSVFDTATNVPLTEIAVGLNPIGLAITPDGKHIYVANQNSDNVSLIATETNTVTTTIPVGSNPIWVTISPDGSRAYVSNQYSYTLSVISTISNSVIASVPVGVFPFHSSFAKGGRFLWVSAQGDNVINVVDTYTNAVVSSIPAGSNPRGIAFSSDGTRAYVADFGSNTVAVIDVLAKALEGFITVGAAPWGLAMAPGGILYVANFGSNTVSVIDSSTNQVTGTVSARTGPADVGVTLRARPLVLAYKFLAVAPTGALYSLVRGLNDHGDVVGDFYDNTNGYRGFLRTHDGNYSIINPPGAAATSAFMINNSGVIVGAYRDNNNVLHGFRRSPAGFYTTVDFPGAPDSQLTGINNLGETLGVYDLGNLASTMCPSSPSCGAISFSLQNGHFSSFEDPAASPGITFAQSVNDKGQIAGFYKDTNGNPFGFLRNPADGSFETIQFPAASSFTTAGQINNSGFVVGDYQITFLQGYLELGSRFLSLDYPNSVMSGLHAVNNWGEIGGYFAMAGGPVEAYIAIPSE